MKKSQPVIDLHQVATVYEGEHIPVIKDITLRVSLGEFVGIIGPNGSGKTTLLETINGLLPYTNGSGNVFGNEITSSRHTLRKDIGYVIQNFEMDPRAPFLCKDIVMSGRSGKIGLFRFTQKKDWEAVWKSMSLVGMIDFANRPVGKLSGGEFQKILLARALAQQPRLLLLDEPFSNLDVSSRHQMEILLNRIHEERKITIVMVSHDLRFIPSACSRLVLIDKGSIVMDDMKQQVLESERVRTLFHLEGHQ